MCIKCLVHILSGSFGSAVDERMRNKGLCNNIIIQEGGGMKNELRKEKYYTITPLSTKSN